MKVVLFCGGFGTRLREHSDTIPKPLVNVGSRPILWHLMRYYAHFGHTDFVLCLGYKGELIRQFFLNYSECASNDFVLSEGGRKVEALERDIENWRITFVDTGLHANIGERLMAVRKYIEDDDVFLANYSDALSDIPVDAMIRDFKARGLVASLAAVRPGGSFHTVEEQDAGYVSSLVPVSDRGIFMNGGFFVLSRGIFEYMRDGEELVEAPFTRLAQARLLGSYRHQGFWMAMDTFKDKITFDRMEARGNCPWMLWRQDQALEPRE